MKENTQSEGLELNEIKRLMEHVSGQVLGQENLVKKLIVSLLANGHILVEGAPGLAKTRAVRTLANSIEGDFHRVQFTPDLLPADLTGTDVYHPQDGTFVFQKGPLFHNIILADEINRSPAKVQSALLEAMEERQITVGSKTYPLPPLFMVMATQNPLEQEGTYALPEAQLDRFLMHVLVEYPDVSIEKQILKINRNELLSQYAKSEKQVFQVISEDIINSARQQVLQIELADNVEDYIVHLVNASRYPEKYDESLKGFVEFGASPRATLALERCSRVIAWLDGRDYVTPEDIQDIAFEVLRHRIVLSYDVISEDMNVEAFINQLLNVVPII